MISRFTGTQWFISVMVLISALLAGPAARAATTIDPGAYPKLFISGPNPAGGNYSDKPILGVTTLDLVPGASYFLDNGAHIGFSYVVFTTDAAGNFPFIDASTAAAVESAAGGVLKLKNVPVTFNVGDYKGQYFLPPNGTAEPLNGSQVRALIPGMAFSFSNGSSYFSFKLGPESAGSAPIDNIDPLYPPPPTPPYTTAYASGSTLYLNTIPVYVDTGGWTGGFRINGFVYSGGSQIVTFLENTPTAIETLTTVTAISTGVSPSSVSVTKGGTPYLFTFSVTPPDTVPPVITAPADITHPTDPGQCSATIFTNGQGFFSLGSPTYSDDRPGVTVSARRSDSHNPNDPYPLGITTVTWTATDAVGNQATAVQKVTVVDQEPPKITVRVGDYTTNTDPGQCTATRSLDASAFDNLCTGNVPVTGTRSDGKSLSDPYPVGVTTITWTATDGAGNTATAPEKVTVIDNQPPTVTPPANATADADSGQCSASSIALGTPSLGDNCPGGTVTGARSDGAHLTDPYPVGTTTVTWTAMDAYGNTATAAQSVTVIDTQKPVIICPADVSQTNDSGQCSARLNPGTATATSNCPGVTVTGTRSDGKDPVADPYPVGKTTITWTATDVQGKQATCAQTITILDTEKPTITNSASVTVSTDAGQCTASNVALGTPTTSDNCGVAGVSNNAPAVFPKGTTTVTWTVTDVSGNTANSTQSVTVLDQEPPKVTCPANIGITATSAAGAVATFPASTATDNCGSAAVSCSPPSGTTFPVGTSTVTCTATDSAGNSSSCTFKVSVIYEWSGVLPPINVDGSSVFKLGSTVPVKFQLTGASAAITNAIATLTYALVSNNVAGPVNEAVSTSAADTGNQFRYSGGQYIFNWSTKGLTIGTYQLKINLGDGVTQTIQIGLR